MDRHLVIHMLLMAVWARQPTQTVLVHSDQGSQYGGADYIAFMKENNLQPPMDRRGKCHDNAVAENFFSTREEARGKIFNFIEVLYNPIKRHSHTRRVSPVRLKRTIFLCQQVSSKSWKILENPKYWGLSALPLPRFPLHTPSKLDSYTTIFTNNFRKRLQYCVAVLVFTAQNQRRTQQLFLLQNTPIAWLFFGV